MMRRTRLLHRKGFDPNPFPLVSTVWTIVTNLGWYEEPPQLNWWPYGGLSTMTAASMMVPWWCIWHLWDANAMVLPQYPKIQKSVITVARASVTPMPLWLQNLWYNQEGGRTFAYQCIISVIALSWNWQIEVLLGLFVWRRPCQRRPRVAQILEFQHVPTFLRK